MTNLTQKEIEVRYGDSAYGRLHYWLRKTYGKADCCESDTCKGISKDFGWALLKGKKYERKRKNFWQLCKSCHSAYDLTEEGRKRISEFQKGKSRPQYVREKISKSRLMRKKRLGYLNTLESRLKMSLTKRIKREIRNLKSQFKGKE